MTWRTNVMTGAIIPSSAPKNPLTRGVDGYQQLGQPRTMVEGLI
jgi:hypothetical protein